MDLKLHLRLLSKTIKKKNTKTNKRNTYMKTSLWISQTSNCLSSKGKKKKKNNNKGELDFETT